MECDTAKELLPFIDGDSLERDEVLSVRRHLAECEQCRREYRSQMAMLHLAKKALTRNEQPCSPEFLVNLHARINRKHESQVLYRLAFSAAAVIIMVVGVMVYSFYPTTAKHSPASGFVLENSTAELDQYVADRYLDEYELSSIVDEQPYTADDSELLETFVSTHYLDVSAEDVMKTMSNEELEQYFASN